MAHKRLEIVGQRKTDLSLIWQCKDCGKKGLDLLGECKRKAGHRPKRRDK